MHGMTLASNALQQIMANRVREVLSKISKHNYLTVLVGIILTVLLQSSGAVTSMLVGLGTAGVVTLTQVMGIIIGTTVGTTLTVQLISFNISQFGLPVFVLAFSIYFLSSNKTFKNVLSVFMGFGLIFFGIELIGIGTKVFINLDEFKPFFKYLSDYPLATIVVSTLFSGFVHNSAVTIGFAISLASSGVISMMDAMYWVYGANIGTTSTGLLASSGGNYVGR